jgi:hypothetical protein
MIYLENMTQRNPSPLPLDWDLVNRELEERLTESLKDKGFFVSGESPSAKDIIKLKFEIAEVETRPWQLYTAERTKIASISYIIRRFTIRVRYIGEGDKEIGAIDVKSLGWPSMGLIRLSKDFDKMHEELEAIAQEIAKYTMEKLRRR